MIVRITLLMLMGLASFICGLVVRKNVLASF